MSKKDDKAVQETVNAPPSEASPFQKSLALHYDAKDFKPLKRLTRDVASITRLGEAVIMCQSNLYVVKMNDQFKPGEMRDVHAVDVLDCLRGEEYTLICGAVMSSTLNRVDDGIRGKYFAIRSGEIPVGKRYRKVEIVQLERVE